MYMLKFLHTMGKILTNYLSTCFTMKEDANRLCLPKQTKILVDNALGYFVWDVIPSTCLSTFL